MSRLAPPGILVAVFLTALAGTAAQAGEGGRARPMTGAEIAEMFPGLSIVGAYDNGDFFTETYFPDGTISYRDDQGTQSGRWKIIGDRFCTKLPQEDRACWTIVRHGDNCFAYHLSQSRRETRALPPDSKWLAIGWNPALPSTCAFDDERI